MSQFSTPPPMQQYLRQKRAAINIQRVWRGFSSRSRWQFAYRGDAWAPLASIRWCAAKLIQRTWRDFVNRTLSDDDLLRREFGCQFPHQCEHRGRACESWCPNAQMNADDDDEFGAGTQTPCSRCQGWGYYHDDSEHKQFRFQICQDCEGTVVPPPKMNILL